MSKFRFSGFVDGASVDVAILSGNITRTIAVDPWGGVTNPTPAAPVISGNLVLGGEPTEGQVLTVSLANITVTGFPEPTLTLTAREGANVLQTWTVQPGQTLFSRLNATADVGNNVFFRLTATNSEGSDTVDSAASLIEAAAPTPAAMTIRVFNWTPNTPAPASVWFEAQMTGDLGLPVRVNGDVSADAQYALDAQGSEYDQQFHEIEYEWSFGDTGEWPHAARHPSPFVRGRNFGHGKIVNHVWANPGSYSVTCWAYRMGVDGSNNLTRTLLASETITFQAGGDYPAIPSVEDVVPLNRRIYFNPEGDYSDVPAGAQTGAGIGASTDMGPVFNWAASRSGSDPVAVFLKRGTTTEWNRSQQPNLAKPRFYVGAYGTGNRPVVQNTTTLGSGMFSTGVTNYTGADRGGWFILNGIEVAGTWNAVTETGAFDGAAFGGESITHHLAYDCVFRDIGGPIVSFQLNTGQSCEIGERSMTVCNTVVRGWRDYGIMVRGNNKRAFRQDFSVLACDIGQYPNASIGATGDKNVNNAHGPLRTANLYNFLVRATDLYSRTHWDVKAQACIRADMNAAQQYGEPVGRTIIYGNICEGGGTQILSSGAGGTAGGATICPIGYSGGQNGCRAHPWPKNTIIKHNFMLGSYSVEQAMAIGKANISVIENVCLRPNVRQWTTNGDFIRARPFGFSMTEVSYTTGPGIDDILDSNGWVTGMNDSVIEFPVWLVGNLTIDLKGSTEAADERSVSDVALIDDLYRGLKVNRDNTLWAPNYTNAPVTSTGPFVYIQDIAPRETYGVRHDTILGTTVGGTFVEDQIGERGRTASMTNNVQGDGIFDEDLSYATPSDALKLYRPASNAGIAAAATGPMGHRDFLGVVRTAGARAAQGAIEPS